MKISQRWRGCVASRRRFHQKSRTRAVSFANRPGTSAGFRVPPCLAFVLVLVEAHTAVVSVPFPVSSSCSEDKISRQYKVRLYPHMGKCSISQEGENLDRFKHQKHPLNPVFLSVFMNAGLFRTSSRGSGRLDTLQTPD